MLAFSVLKPWYLTWWALTLFALVTVLVVDVIVRIRGAQLRRRNRELRDIIDAKTAALREATHTDPLTSLRNRRFFFEVIGPETAAQAHPRLALLLVDLDFFKSVNDRFGHAAGDAVLVEAAERLRAVARDTDLLFRWGGEEFLLIARDERAGDAAKLAGQILAAFVSPSFRDPNDASFVLSVSVGWTQFPLREGSSDVSIEAAIDLADRALYQAKAQGRNRAVGFIPASPGPSRVLNGEVWPGEWVVILGPTGAA